MTYIRTALPFAPFNLITMKRKASFLLSFLFLFQCSPKVSEVTKESTKKVVQPNILFAIADDQSYPYTTAYGDRTTITPAFDALAKRGVLFNNAFCAAPQCSPSRAAILTGKNIWQLEEAGTHSSYFPKKIPVFTDALEAAGYALGFTGKPWGPGNWKDVGRDRNPVGPEFNTEFLEKPYTGVSNKDYAANFGKFLAQKNTDQPFFFWYGGHEPHRVFEDGSGIKEGKKPGDANVPSFLPEDEIVKSDILDYSVEIEWFDKHLGDMIAQLEAMGELEHTVIVVTADNGMAFPYAKANLQEYGTHVPLVIAGPNIKGGRRVDDLVSLIDLAPTFLQIGRANPLPNMTGNTLINILTTRKEGLVDPTRDWVLTGRERHTHARPNNFGYPARAIRTAQHLYIHNFQPDRWPAGDPEVEFPKHHKPPEGFKSMAQGYHDIDACPTKTLLLENQEKYESYFYLAVAKRGEDELYDIVADPGCTNNLANRSEFESTRKRLKNTLINSLRKQGDPRVLGTGDVFESYPRFGGMREFDGFKIRGEYNPAYQK